MGLLSACACAHAHTTYLRPLGYTAAAGESVEVLVFNGKFDESVQAAPVESVNKLISSGPFGIFPVDKEAWHLRESESSAWRQWNKLKDKLGGMDQRRTSIINFSSEEEGAHVIGLQFHPARIAMDMPKFAEYLEEVGLQDEPISRFKASEPDAIVKEQWTKTAKTIIDIGSGGGGDVTRPTGLSAEIVPLSHPRDVRTGQMLKLQLLISGRPLPNQVVLAGREQGFAGKGRGDHTVHRSNADGIVDILITDGGEWWVGFNLMRPAKPGQEVDLVTYWTTLTFEID